MFTGKDNKEMLIQEDWVEIKDDDHRCDIGNSGLYEPFTDELGKLYKAFQREYGRCVGKVYVDKPDNSAMAIGWVFQKRAKYEDCNDTYILETWITLHKDQPKRTIEYHYQELKG